MKTGIVAAFGLLMAACSGQVVGGGSTQNSPTVGYAAAGFGIGPVIICARAPCGCSGRYCPPHDEAFTYGDNSHLSQDEMAVENQMEEELVAAQKAAAEAAAAEKTR